MPEAETIASQFTRWDWLVVFGYLFLTTWIGHRLSGKNATIREFFLGGRSLPWWAVSGSMIATEISALTFIGVPGMVYALHGDWTYLQWGIGSVIARFAVAWWLVPLYYKQEIYSPYDFMGARLGEPVRKLVTGLFSIGAILGQSVRVLVTAIILQTVTGFSATACIIIIGVFAVIWTLMGGMRTVIWTDVVQFCLFILGGLLALGWLVGTLGIDGILTLNSAAGPDGEVDKLRVFNLTPPWESPLMSYTLWVAILAMPFQNFTAFGTDQLNTQRIFCCGSAREARKAVAWSSVSLIITVLMLAVGAGLYAWYLQTAPTDAEAAWFAKDTNYVFPIWITTVLPVGLSGLILAAAFAAAITSLDSILAALSQTSLSAWYGRERLEREADGRAMVFRSRVAVVVWAMILTAFALMLTEGYQSEEPGADSKNLINLAFGILTYTYGPLLGVLLAAIIPGQRNIPGLFIGVGLSILGVALIRPELPQLLNFLGVAGAEDVLSRIRPGIAFPWLFPINAAITLAFAFMPRLGGPASLRNGE
ncbi:MAG: sodium:solute symporter family transporter [Luteolibacter sp.]|jgi:solute:Na+ symporter, SSS family